MVAKPQLDFNAVACRCILGANKAVYSLWWSNLTKHLPTEQYSSMTDDTEYNRLNIAKKH